MQLSILDLVPVGSGGSSGRALRDSLSLVRLADRLGYTRHWFAEHHNMPSIASTTPAIMIALAAEATTRIRVGAGGVMLPNHAPLQVAEAYKMLEALHPGRIDLGLGRAPGTDQLTAFALRRSAEALAADDFPEQLSDLVNFGGAGTWDPRHPFRKITAAPDHVVLPPIWLLGSSGFSARLAARLGMGFGFAAHFSPEPAEGPMSAYRDGFEPGARAVPHAILTLSVICAETEDEAERLATTMQLAWVRLRSTGRMGKLPTPEEAAAHVYTPEEQAAVAGYRAMQIIGTPDRVKARIEARAAATRADEVMVTTVVHDHAARERSYALVAEAFGLARSAV